MSATLVAITDEPRTPTAHQQRLWERLHEAKDAMHAAIKDSDDPKMLHDLFSDCWSAWCKCLSHLEHRTRKAERQLRALLDMDLTDEQRANVLSTLRIDKSRNRLLLSDYEQQIVDQYRRMNAKGTTMIRELFAILAVTNDSEPATAAEPKGGAR
jgi:hypothetical protein